MPLALLLLCVAGMIAGGALGSAVLRETSLEGWELALGVAIAAVAWPVTVGLFLVAALIERLGR